MTTCHKCKKPIHNQFPGDQYLAKTNSDTLVEICHKCWIKLLDYATKKSLN